MGQKIQKYFKTIFIESCGSEGKATRKTSMKHFQISPHGNSGKGKQAAENQNGPCCCCYHSSKAHPTNRAIFILTKSRGYNDGKEKDVSIKKPTDSDMSKHCLIISSTTLSMWK